MLAMFCQEMVGEQGYNAAGMGVAPLLLRGSDAFPKIPVN